MLVGEDEDYGVLISRSLIRGAALAGLVDAVAVGAVHYEDQTLGPGCSNAARAAGSCPGRSTSHTLNLTFL